MNVYLTGDTHRRFERIVSFCRRMETTPEDVIAIMGDVGINYYVDSSDYRLKEKLTQLSVTLFCVHGNHEERPYNVPGYFEQQWHGGTVYMNPLFPNQIFAKDGEIYNLNGKKVLILGGAYSVDKQYRLMKGWRWFESEQPDDKIKEHVVANLDKAGWKVDTVFSHTCPFKYMPQHLFLKGINQNTVDNSTEHWLQEIEEKLAYDKWYFGHFHADNYTIDKLRMLYMDIIELI